MTEVPIIKGTSPIDLKETSGHENVKRALITPLTPATQIYVIDINGLNLYLLYGL